MKHLILLLCATTLMTPLSAKAGFFDKKEEVTKIIVPPAGAPLSFADLSEKLSPDDVNISSTQKVMQQQPQEMPDLQFPPGSPFEDFFKDFMNKQGLPNGEQPSEIPMTSLGSGFIIDGAKGLIVTNNHVVKDADEVRVTLVDNTILEAEIIGKDYTSQKVLPILMELLKDDHIIPLIILNSDYITRLLLYCK